MNIFVSNNCPIKSAQFLDDKRVVKMILESAQLLSTAINECGGKGPYKNTHKNHPSAVWARETKNNYMWLFDHYIALCNEYKQRYNKEHKCYSLKQILLDNLNLIPDGPLTPFPNCTIFKNETDVIKAYNLYLLHKWEIDKRIPTWYGKTRDKVVSESTQSMLQI